MPRKKKTKQNKILQFIKKIDDFLNQNKKYEIIIIFFVSFSIVAGIIFFNLKSSQIEKLKNMFTQKQKKILCIYKTNNGIRRALLISKKNYYIYGDLFIPKKQNGIVFLINDCEVFKHN